MVCRSFHSTFSRLATSVLNSFDHTEASAALDNADKSEDLVPIRLDMEVEGQKLRDTFTWNKNGEQILPH